MQVVYFKTGAAEPVGLLCTRDGKIDFSRLGREFKLIPSSIQLNAIRNLKEGLKSLYTWEQIKAVFEKEGEPLGTKEDAVIVTGEAAVPAGKPPLNKSKSSLGASEALRQVLEENISDEKFTDDEIQKLVDAGFTKEDLDSVFLGRPGMVRVLLKSFVQRAVVKDRFEKLSVRVDKLSALMNKRRKTAYTDYVPVTEVDDVTKWEVENLNVPCTTGPVDTLLDAERALVADLRYLYLWHRARKIPVNDILTMKKSRKRSEADLERVYYTHALTIMEASALGQDEVQVLGEDYLDGDGARAHFRVYVRDREYPSEMKAVNGLSNALGDVTGICNNRAAFGKLHKVIRAKFLEDGVGGTFLTAFLNRIECIWFARFNYGTDKRMIRCQVAPEIPAKGLMPFAQICPGLDDICDNHKGDESVKLVDLLDEETPSGFRCLTRYIDTLCRMNDVPINPVAFVKHDGVALDMKGAWIVARGGKSLIIQVGEENAVLKVGPRFCIENECKNHRAVDQRAPKIRVMVEGVHGSVSGVVGLAFIKLKGLGRCISEISWEQLGEFWGAMEEALSGLHACLLLHRDVKPDNMLMIDDKLVLHDFDVSCLSNDSQQLKQYVGTPQFRSPYWKPKTVYVPADDWISLGLSFSSLLRLPAEDDPLKGLIDHPRTPLGMKSKIGTAIKLAKARKGDFLN